MDFYDYINSDDIKDDILGESQSLNFNEFCRSFKIALNEAEKGKRSFSEIYELNIRYTINHLMNHPVTYGIDAEYFDRYLNIDHSWWKFDMKDPVNGVNLHDWEMYIAVEYANESSTWTYEIAKLDFVIAKLRVAIGYMDNSKREEELKVIEAQRKKLKNLGVLPKDYELGVILMNKDYDSDKEDPIDMRCYSLTSDATRRVTLLF